MKIAIIGAGLSGLVCADALIGAGHQVRLFDKARGPGGRMSTRRAQTAAGELRFDHGAQYFTARAPGFQAVVEQWQENELAAKWPAAGDEAWVGTPSMNTPVKAMATHHDVTWSMRIESLVKQQDHWQIHGEDGSLEILFDAAVIAVPAEQAADLLDPLHSRFADTARSTVSDPCWTVMLAFAEPLATDIRILKDRGAIGWAARNSDKPMREGADSWVIQGSPDWSRDHLEDDPEQVCEALVKEFTNNLAMELPEPIHAAAHRWRYARSGSAGVEALYDNEAKLGACGDWLLGPRIECAWLSGNALSQMMLG
ncbi:MAG: FAD-dependent oxidoreductase [Parasphingorhabdus sp.]